MSDITAFDNDLNQKILTGQAMEGFEKYYADDVVMQENSDAPFVGKDLNRKREIEFFSSIGEFHGAKVEAAAVNGDASFGQWWMDVTFKNGPRVQLNQVAVRKWKDGKIVHERFFYNKG
ncbi:MAG TPA: nuclear transport factor 2 family protein [Bryobacteraceae bacterium]|nr:nuclear transport factor 2 family protein [Bryobacteraceae bacterium]